MSDKIAINGAFADCIRGIQYHATATVPHYMYTKEVTLDNSSSKEEVLKMISESVSFTIESTCSEDRDDNEGFITCMIKRDESEIQEWLADQETSKLYSIKRLKKWFDSEERHAIQIEAYLIHIKQEWILEAIKA